MYVYVNNHLYIEYLNKSSFLLSSWYLTKGWSLDACLDEKSKATIEKMLQEEQYPS